ncbi:hypothetical protein [Brevibacillus reuszeri]|uniref:hypothetical protein n=1 Tax=Brevibacillus reuszeri TaxID=54915 RepID=UPI000CCC0B9D|nr:hypothetical protein [Brevibacillus reuszeri]
MARVRSSLSDRNKRHEAIESLVDSRKITSHRYLGEILRERGIHVTQPTLSRDLEELSIQKNPDTKRYELSKKKDALKEKLTKIIDDSHAALMRPTYSTRIFKVDPEYSHIFAITLEKFLMKKGLEVGIFVGPTGSVLLSFPKEAKKLLNQAIRELSVPERSMTSEDGEDDSEEI